MPRQDLVDHVNAVMSGWSDGLPDTLSERDYPDVLLQPGEAVDKAALKTFNNNWRAWAFRVRRDILMIEKLLIPDDKERAKVFYGDPGDPPPPPPGEI